MKFLRHSPTPPAPSITPLLDVVFILLIFFAVSTSFLYIGGINVNLPKAETTEETENIAVRITVAKGGELSVNNREISYDNLAAALEAAYKNTPNAVIVIEADRESLHGLVVEVIDTGKLAGFERFAIATEK
ncbi:MAG: biopolymer transporter ExbD [Deferribacteraceae bacterium]|jgi:biopolymer transport protein ExbD|nr:biopolymer transporter ExbD [Deferribacteraceae bacterium]